jgi:hypothetical protein
MRRYLEILLTVEAIIFLAAYFICFTNQEEIRVIVAHITGIVVILTMLFTLYKFCQKKIYKIIKNKFMVISFILLILGLLGMTLGYISYLFEHFSPYSHAIASLNFDLYTILYTLGILTVHRGLQDGVS